VINITEKTLQEDLTKIDLKEIMYLMRLNNLLNLTDEKIFNMIFRVLIHNRMIITRDLHVLHYVMQEVYIYIYFIFKNKKSNSVQSQPIEIDHENVYEWIDWLIYHLERYANSENQPLVEECLVLGLESLAIMRKVE
jgi:hypothetical protein